jgi:hypothetical protein
MLQKRLTFLFGQGILGIMPFTDPGLLKASRQPRPSSEWRHFGMQRVRVWSGYKVISMIVSGAARARGYIPVEELSPQQRLDLERRGLLPNNALPAAKP